MVQAELVVAGIRGLIRAGKAANAALIQYEIEADVFVPELRSARGETRLDLIKEIFSREDQIGRLRPGGELADYWDFEHSVPRQLPAESEDVLYLAAVDVAVRLYGAENGIPEDRARAAAGARLLRQWSEDRDAKRPVKPLPRFLLALADAALEIVGANPSLLGIGGSGEKLVGALAANLASLIPDDADQFGPQSQFADHLLRLFLRASLQTLHDRSDVVLPQRHLSQLARNFLGPVVDALPEEFLAQQSWHEVASALTGPAARAAFETLAENPGAFLGRELDPDNAVGAVTQALFSEASRLGLGEVFSEAGAIALYRATLGVVAERPELFAPKGADRTTQTIAAALFRSLAETLRAAPGPFDDDLGVELAVAALAVLKEHGAGLLPADAPWEALISALVREVASAVSEGLDTRDPRTLERLFSRGQLARFGRVFVEAAASNPEWIAGGSPELANLVRAVASARRADAGGLLSADAWIELAREVAGEAAASPGRLFPVAERGDGLGAALIADLIRVASDDAARGRAAGGVLFGATLQAALGIALRAAASQATIAAARRPDLAALAARLCALARERSGEIGSAEWLALYRLLLPRILAGEQVLEKSPEALIALLVGGATP